MSKTTDDSNIIRHPRRLPFSFITVVFIIMLLYIIVHVILFFTKTRIQVYELGAAEADSIQAEFKGVLLRDELVYASDVEGYVNFLAVPEDRLSKGTQAVILDKDGNLEEELHSFYYGQDILKTNSILNLQNVVRNAVDHYDPNELYTLRRERSIIRETVFRALLEDGGSDVLTQLSHDITGTVETSTSGFFLLYKDGMENKRPEDLTFNDFSQEAVKRTVRYNGDHVDAGDFLYKMVEDNKFTLVFPLTEDQSKTLARKKNLTVRMPDGDEISGRFSVTKGADATDLGVLQFQKYGGNYLEERLISFKLIDKSAEGLKVPENALVTKNYFVVDEKFITRGGDSGNYGVMKQVPGQEPEFIKASVCLKTDAENANLVIGENSAYVYADGLNAGDVLTIDTENNDKTYSHDETTLSVMVSVEGVYQINYGYCIFKPVLRIDQSMESSYVMISPSVSGTIRPYDRIVMDPEHVSEYEIIYE